MYSKGLLGEISEVLGTEAAHKLAAAKGGGRVRTPARIKDSHWLVELLGREDALNLGDHFTSGHTTQDLDIPLGLNGARQEMRAKLDRLLAAGSVSSDAIARALGISRRTVLRRKAALRGKFGKG